MVLIKQQIKGCGINFVSASSQMLFRELSFTPPQVVGRGERVGYIIGRGTVNGNIPAREKLNTELLDTAERSRCCCIAYDACRVTICIPSCRIQCISALSRYYNLNTIKPLLEKRLVREYKTSYFPLVQPPLPEIYSTIDQDWSVTSRWQQMDLCLRSRRGHSFTPKINQSISTMIYR